MARNLREKIRALVQDAYDLRQESVITKIENLITEELNLRAEDRDIKYNDIAYIQSAAVQEFTETRMDSEALGRLAGDAAMVRTLCLVNATVSFLRQKGLLSTILRYKK